MQNVTAAWGQTIKYFQKNQEEDYNLWIMNLVFHNFSKRNKKLTLAVSNAFVRENIMNKFKEKIESVFSSYMELDSVELEIQISDEKSLLEESTLKQLLQEETPEKGYTDTTVPLKSAPHISINLNPKFTFDRFVIGSNSKLAYAAATLIAQKPGEEYNPFFIYGGSGLGKTHLMQAIGNYIHRHRPELRIVYATVEQYMNDYTMALMKGKGGSPHQNNLPSFRKKYREADILLLDDIQFLEKTDRLQEELFNNFNNVYQGNKQIIFTCDKPPKDLKNVEERLITRFSWGLVTDIKQPDLETRKAIIIQKVEENGLSRFVDTKIIDFLAESIASNIRDIESAVLKMKSLIFLTEEKLSIAILENNLGDILTSIRAKKRQITSEVIQREVANYYHISYSDMKSAKRTKDVSFPRQMAMFLSKELLKLSYSEIGNEFGGRDHSTIVASHKKVSGDIKKNSSTRNDYEELLKIFSNY